MKKLILLIVFVAPQRGGGMGQKPFTENGASNPATSWNTKSGTTAK